MSAAVMLATSLTTHAHISYSGRDFGTLDPAGTTTATINGQAVSTRFGWADGADADWGDSHRTRNYRFKLNTASYVTITFTGVSGGTQPGTLLFPGFSVYGGLAHIAPAALDHDFGQISQAWLATQFGAHEACFNALGDWKIGSDTGTSFADLSSFTFYGYAVDGTSANYGTNPVIVGDGNADHTVTGTFYLPAGDYSIMVGGAEYNTQVAPPLSSVYLDANAPSDTTRRSYTDTYGINGTVSVSATNPASLVSFSAPTFSTNYGTTTAYVTVTRPVGGPAFTVALNATDGTALAATHYTAPTAAVAFALNEASRVVAIPVVAQTGIQPDRSFTLALGTPTNGVGLGTQTSSTVAIKGNDSGGVMSLASTAINTLQGSTSISVTVNRTASLVPATVALTTTDGSAAAGSDFTAPTSTVDFAANETSKTVAITLIPRTGVQPVRTFTIGLGATTGNATVGSPSSLTVTINPLTGSAPAATVTNADPGGDGITYAWQVEAGANSIGTFKDHVGAWSWEDDSLFTPPEPTVGWTHTSRWMALRLTQPTVVTVTMARDATVAYAGGGNVGGFADTTSMFPSFTLWKNWDEDGSDDHTYNNRGNVAWAEDLVYLDHVDNSTDASITRSWYLPAGDYTFAMGSNAPATNPNRQGFSFTLVTSQTAPVDLVPNTYPTAPTPSTGGVGYGYTVIGKAGASGSFKDTVGAWSWEDNALFAPGEPAVGWTHTSKWVQVKLLQDTLFTVAVNRDATVPDVSGPGGFADTSSMFPSFTLFRGADQDGSDNHTYNNKGRVGWAEDLTYLAHVDNSTDDSVTRTFRLPAGDYTFAVGSNAPATNPLSQGFSFNWSAQAAAAVTPITSPSGSGVPYAYTLLVAAGDTGSIKDHVGAWSWEDNSLFGPGDDPVGWTHTSKWVAVMLKDTVTLNVTMARDATVPWPSQSDAGRLADTSSMFPSLTIWRGWDQDGMQDHTYNNHGNVAWAEDLNYIDHINNSTANSITRSWTLPAGLYTFVLGSNAPATNSNRQGFSFSYSTSAPQFVSPQITKQPAGLSLNAGAKATFSVTATGPSLAYQWRKDGVNIDGATSFKYDINTVALTDAGNYTVEVRNAAGAVVSNPAVLEVIGIPVMNTVTLPDVTIGMLVNTSVSATNNPTSFTMTGRLPTGVAFNAKTGAITGRALAAGNFAVSFKATNRAGTSVLPQGDTLTVSKLFGDGIARAYTGVLGRSSTMNGFLGGCIKINTTVVGGFTGSLVMGTKTYPLGGLLDTSASKPTGTQTIARTGQGSLVVSFTIDDTAGQATGTIVDGPWTLPFIARKPTATLTAFAGNYTLALKFDAADQGDTTKPQGYGYGAFTVAATGATTGSITLADETKVTFSGPLEAMGNLTIFKVLYSNLGSVIATLHIDDANNNALDDSRVNWFKQGTTTGTDRVYKAGFPELNLITVGRKYVIPTSGLALDATAGSNNAKLAIETTPARLSTNVTIVAGSPKAVTFPSNTYAYSLTATPGIATKPFVVGTTGSFKGSFTLTAPDVTNSNKPLARKVTFNGMIVDDGSGQKGYGTCLVPQMPVAGPPKTTINTSPKDSIGVLFEKGAIVP
jgi:hypothetical protein